MMSDLQTSSGRAWAGAGVLGLVLLITVPAGAAASDIVTPADGYAGVDLLPGEWPETFCAFGEDVAVFSVADGLEIVDPDNPTSRQSWGRPDDYLELYRSGSLYYVWSGFITPDPSGTSLWVGFTVDENMDDRIYQVDAGGTWTHRATLAGNFDLEFSGADAFVSANPGTVENPFEPDSSLYLLDTSGNNHHDLLVHVGGYSAGLGVDGSGNVYYGTYFLDGSDNRMVRYSAAQIASALGPNSLTLEDAEELFAMSSGSYDVDVDDGGNVVFDGNDGSSSHISVWEPSEDGGHISQVAVCDAGSSWLTLVDVVGDVTVGGGRVLGLDWYEPGIAEVTKLIPGDADGDGAVGSSDAAVLAEHWQEMTHMHWADGDFDGDGAVDAADASILAANWGSHVSAQGEGTDVPEPSAMVLLAAVLAGLAMRRHRGRWKKTISHE